MASRVAHHIDFPDYSPDELVEIAELLVAQMDYRLDAQAIVALREYIALRLAQPHFANGRSVRNALDRARLRQASRLFANAGNGGPAPDRDQLMTISAEDLRASRVFRGGRISDTTNH